VAFRPHGTMMATAGADGIVRLWNDKILNRLAAGRSIGAPFTFPGPISSMAFSPNGQLLATAGQDGTVQLWDVSTHQQIGESLTAGSDSVTDVTCSPGGRILITTDTDGSTRLWNVFLPRRPASQVCSIAHGSLGPRQWDTYIQNVPFMTVC
jgi:WD40 repeat protein